jgi:protein-S-isoprenylcysteine O-methyltransferase Ste14
VKPELTKNKNRFDIMLPRWSVPIVWAVTVWVIQILLPWAVSRFGPRLGWSQPIPALWNIAGLIAVVLGLALYAWCLVFHFRSYHASVRVGFSPPHLVIAGPYKISRNPMYVSGLFVWFGWMIFYGSPAVFIALVILFLIFSFRVIPGEERQLARLFGDEYLNYKRTVRRWIGRF